MIHVIRATRIKPDGFPLPFMELFFYSSWWPIRQLQLLRIRPEEVKKEIRSSPVVCAWCCLHTIAPAVIVTDVENRLTAFQGNIAHLDTAIPSVVADSGVIRLGNEYRGYPTIRNNLITRNPSSWKLRQKYISTRYLDPHRVRLLKVVSDSVAEVRSWLGCDRVACSRMIWK